MAGLSIVKDHLRVHILLVACQECPVMHSRGAVQCGQITTIATPGMSSPREATSVATRTPGKSGGSEFISALLANLPFWPFRGISVIAPGLLWHAKRRPTRAILLAQRHERPPGPCSARLGPAHCTKHVSCCRLRRGSGRHSFWRLCCLSGFDPKSSLNYKQLKSFSTAPEPHGSA